MKNSDNWKIDINEKNVCYKTAFDKACENGHLDIVELYLERLPIHKINSGLISVNPVYQGRTPLHAAAQKGYLDIVKAISKHLTNLNPENALETTPLILAVDNGRPAIVEYFTGNLKDINLAGRYATQCISGLAQKTKPAVLLACCLISM